jgi:hypothetical protein
LDQRRSSKGEKLLMSTTDWRKHCTAIPQWPAPSYEQWKLDNASPRPPPRRDAVDIAQLRVELVAISSCRFITPASPCYRPASTHVACSDKPVALGSNDSIAKAKELQEWSAQIDRMDELVHTREELRAYSPAPSRFNDIPYSCRSYSPPRQRPCPRALSLVLRYIFTASLVSRIPLWARCSEGDRLQEQDVVDDNFIAAVLQVNLYLLNAFPTHRLLWSPSPPL